MDLTEYRSQFDLHLLVPFSEDYQEIKVALREKGHSVFHSTSTADFFEEFKQSPSHLVILDLSLEQRPIDDFLAECMDIASQTNFIIIGSRYSRQSFWEYRDYGVLDYISNDENLLSAISWSIENSLERVVLKIFNANLMNENEELKKQIIHLKTRKHEESQTLLEPKLANIVEGFIEANPEVLNSESLHSSKERANSSQNSIELNYSENYHGQEDIANLLTLYENTRNREDLIQVFFHSLERFCVHGAKVLYFKYLEPVQLLVATHGCGIPVDQIKGAGIRLTSEEALESQRILKSPRGFGSLNKLLEDIFHIQNPYVKPMLLREDIDGLFVFFGSSLETFNTIQFNNLFSLFRVSFERFCFLKRQMEMELEGVLDRILSYEEFYEILNDRMELAQRHQMGLALLRISIDKLHYIEENFGPTAVNSVIRALAVTGKKFTRSMDGIHRTALNEFTLLIAHVKPQEATILGERIRVALESLDIPPVTGSITVSVGISVYPQLATTVETLLKSSLQALTAVMGQGGNKVGIARVVTSSKINKKEIVEETLIERE